MNEPQFIDAESYSMDRGHVSFREIVLLHLQRITALGSVELRGGFWKEKPRMSHNIAYTETVYVPSTKDSYMNAIDMLHDLLLPLFDKKMKEAIKKLEEETKNMDKSDKEAKLKLKRKLFQQLSLLLNRLRYLEGKSFGDVA